MFKDKIFLVFEGIILLVGRNNLPCARRYKKIVMNVFCCLFLNEKRYKNKKKPLNDQQLFVVKGGAGGIRTLVQTGKPYAFYMLILAFGFRVATRPRPPIATLSSKISPVQRGILELFPIYLHRLILRFGTTSLEQCLVLPPCGGIKLIYCASIKQRERNCFRQLNF